MARYFDAEEILTWYNQRRDAYDKDQVSFAIDHLDDDQEVINPDSTDTIAAINQLEGRRQELQSFSELMLSLTVIVNPETTE